MPQSIQQLREDRTALAQKVNKLVKDHPEDQEWTNQHQEDYDNAVAAIDKLDAKIERHNKLMEIEASNHERIQTSADRSGLSTDEVEHRNQLQRNATAAWMRGGVENLTDEDREALSSRVATSNEFRMPRNAMSTGTPAEGGYLTDNVFVADLQQAMRAFGGMREMARVISTETGSPMDWPTTDATSEEGEIVGENTTVTDEDTSFGTKQLGTHKYSSKGIAVPFELLQDGLIDIEAYIRELLAQRLGRVTERHFTVGTGVGQPEGIITGAAVGRVAASATEVTFDELIDLEHSVDPAYRSSASCGFQFHDNTLRSLKKVKDLEGRPIWLPSLTEGAPNQINGYGYRVNQNVSPMSANAVSVAFGDFSKYIIRDVMQMMLFRFTDSAYTRKGQVGFLAFMRSGGRLVDVGGAVKTLQQAP